MPPIKGKKYPTMSRKGKRRRKAEKIAPVRNANVVSSALTPMNLTNTNVNLRLTISDGDGATSAEANYNTHISSSEVAEVLTAMRSVVGK